MRCKAFVSIVVAAAAMISLAGPASAQQATLPTGQGITETSEGITLTKVSTRPSQVQQAVGDEKARAAEIADPAGYATRLALIASSPKTQEYLNSFQGIDVTRQAEGLAGLMNTEALTGFTQMIDQGALELRVTNLKNGDYQTQMIIKSQPQMRDTALRGMPRCPAAWAAFWAWFATEAAMCGALAPWPAAAFACAAAYAVGGSMIDFNRGC
ncbi:hypothetical protein [Acaricomes phytoseiuli]|uniref:hypothetical protein n=1 Tax=Acaricomes phytoseiuli TaxID=291968 RepID=UPI00036F34B9|nr:hypothetical protein [Acaricomes phytoseiuli]